MSLATPPRLLLPLSLEGEGEDLLGVNVGGARWEEK